MPTLSAMDLVIGLSFQFTSKIRFLRRGTNSSTVITKELLRRVASETKLCSRAYHLFEKMVDAHCVRDEEGFALNWLAAFQWVRVRVYLMWRVCQPFSRMW